MVEKYRYFYCEVCGESLHPVLVKEIVGHEKCVRILRKQIRKNKYKKMQRKISKLVRKK